MRTLLAIACLAALGGCAIVVAPGADGDYQVRTPFNSNTVDGDGIAGRDQRAVGTVNGLDVNGAIVVDVRVGPATSLVVEADGNLLPLIRTDVRGDTLNIYAERSYRSRNPVHVIYTVPRLTDLRQNGSGRITVQGLSGAPLTLRRNGSGSVSLSGQVGSLEADSNGSGSVDAAQLKSASARLSLTGSGRLEVGQVRGDYAIVNLNGSGQLRGGGAVRSLTARANGTGHLDLAQLSSDQADLSSSGSGGITANVRQSLIAQNGGSGGIRVLGNPGQRSVSGNHIQMLN
ncbi:head GIN domain-containing protein [Massilia sp. LXY-6]|uniref:head GIN domain-containing protein n=1 Tax=Massilia sp. LXY-6 TaxID=3379823 RepID=UPI003EE40465